MAHTSLTLEEDSKLIDTIMDDVDMRYIILFLYVIRNDLFKDLSDENLVESYNRILNLDEIFKSNVVKIKKKSRRCLVRFCQSLFQPENRSAIYKKSIKQNAKYKW